MVGSTADNSITEQVLAGGGPIVIINLTHLTGHFGS